jgi:hypothetical protein
MKINNVNQGKIEELTNRNSVEKNEKSGGDRERAGETGGNTSQLSRLGNLIYRARVEASRTDNVRQEKVQKARQRIEQGYYDSPGVRSKLVSKLAEKVIASMKD